MISEHFQFQIENKLMRIGLISLYCYSSYAFYIHMYIETQLTHKIKRKSFLKPNVSSVDFKSPVYT